MILETLRAAAALLILLVLGGGLYQCLSRRRVPLDELLAYGWGLGLSALFVAGLLFLQLNLSLVHLPWLLVPGAGGVLTGALIRRNRMPGPTPAPVTKWDSISLMVGLLILIKLLLVLVLAVTNPVIDSDAAEARRWVGRAKILAAPPIAGTPSPGWEEQTAPSLIPFWVALFLSRWHDSLVLIPWWITLVSGLALVVHSASKFTGSRRFAMVLTGLVLTLPLLSVHVIRPGFADLFVTYFLMGCLAVFLRRFFRGEASGSGLLLVFFVLNLLLTKNEGMVWGAWVVLLFASFGAVRNRWCTWKQLLLAQLAAAAVLFPAYLLLADFLVAHLPMDPRVALMFQPQVSWEAVKAFLEVTLAWGGFNALWWFFLLTSCYLLCFPEEKETRILAGYLLLLFLGLFFFCCFTGNVVFTLAQNNVGRFLLQITGVAIPPALFLYRPHGQS